MIYLDTETCGLHGVAVILQYAIDDSEIEIYNLWKNKLSSTLNLLRLIAEHKEGICGFNLVFDWFHIQKIYNIFSLALERLGDIIPEEHIESIAYLEKEARDGKCIKPCNVLDLFLVAKKGRYQSTMDRKDVKIRKVPLTLAQPLADELNRRIKLNELYFARRKDKSKPWHVLDCIDRKTGTPDPDFRDVVLTFAPSSALKALAVDALGIPAKDILKFGKVALDKKLFPKELGFAPFWEAVGYTWGWPSYLKFHIEHWEHNEKAREYAALDVEYLRRLRLVLGNPQAGDDDSVLTCAIASIRWRGFKIDIDRLKKLRADKMALMQTAPRSPQKVKELIWPLLTDDQKIHTQGSTKGVILEWLKEAKTDCSCTCEGEKLADEDCKACSGKGWVPHPAAKVAKMVLESRKAKKDVENIDKILLAGRFHASFKIIGALSGRMSGSDGLNAQGQRATKEFRSCFPLAPDGMSLIGGDFESFEVVIALAEYRDKQLEHDLQEVGVCPDCKGKKEVFSKKEDKTITCQGCNGSGQTKKKIHGIFGSLVYGKSYEDIVFSKGEDFDMYKRGKSGLFSQMYGGNYFTLMDRLGLDEAGARRGEEAWKRKYPGIANAQRKVQLSFQSMRQPDGIGKKVVWQDPAEYIESMLGFRRYFTLENQICKALYDLGEKPPTEWQNIKVRVVRRDRAQSASGAVRSALFGAAFNIQSSNTRAATNHRIQSTGAGITKRTQCRIWEFQPTGVSDWVVMPMNVHDELMNPCKPEIKEQVYAAVMEEVNRYKEIIPLISISWENNMATWADKT